MKEIEREERLQIYKTILSSYVNETIDHWGLCLLLSGTVTIKGVNIKEVDWRRSGLLFPEFGEYFNSNAGAYGKPLKYMELYRGHSKSKWRIKVLKEIIKSMESC